jgi:hypothetical protein
VNEDNMGNVTREGSRTFRTKGKDKINELEKAMRTKISQNCT